MTKIDIFSGFLGAGKTTLIKKLISEAYSGEKLVLIENEFGEIGIDGGFMQDAGIEVTEMNSGCICCSLVGDFGEALEKVLDEYAPDRILIEPSGVGKLSDVIRAVQGINSDKITLNSFTAVADANKCKMYMKNFGEFYNDQIENAACVVLSHTDGIDDIKLEKCVELLREHNKTAVIVTTPWDKLSGTALLEAMERKDTLAAELEHLEHDEHHHHHEDGEECHCHDEHEHHHHHEDGEECHCHDEHEHHHHHEDGEECHCHDEHEHHHHHEDGEECHCHDEHEHHHHHEDGEECHCHDEHHHHHHHEDGEECHCHDEHHHHHNHHADDVFTSWGMETTAKFTKEKITEALKSLENEEVYGIILRAKGIVQGEDGEWIHFDYVPGEPDVRTGSAGIIGRLCVIGSKIKEDELKKLF